MFFKNMQKSENFKRLEIFILFYTIFTQIIDNVFQDGDHESEEFLTILNSINPSCESAISKDEFIRYMLSRETTQVKGKEDIEAAFRAIADPEKSFITVEELRTNLNNEQAEYCIRIMPKYEGNLSEYNL
jgi:Ca2+-binding EF-hand superfamily protein